MRDDLVDVGLSVGSVQCGIVAIASVLLFGVVHASEKWVDCYSLDCRDEREGLVPDHTALE